MTEEFYIPKIIKGIGSFDKLGEETKKIGERPFVLTGGSNRYKDKILDLLGNSGIDLHDDDIYSIENEPTLNDAEKCLRAARDYRHDSIIGIGGGSVLDVTKCVAAITNNDGYIGDYTNLAENKKIMVKPPLSKILIPTTAGSGSEVTRVSVLIDDATGNKAVIYDNHLYADAVILDGALTISLPKEATACTGLDAFVHAFEAYTSRKANHMTDALACEAMKLISNNIIDAYMNGKNVKSRQAMLEASSMAGSAFINSSSGPIHGTALPINSKYKIPHGKAVAMKKSAHPLVGIVMGSDSDWPIMQAAAVILKEFGVNYEARVVSAHRTPDLLFDYASAAADRGLKAIIAGAGGAAHLPGMLASMTLVPVLGVPVPSKHLCGQDSLYSIVQMPSGIPVATFAIGEAGAANAALFAVAMLANEDDKLGERLAAFRRAQSDKVMAMKLPEV